MLNIIQDLHISIGFYPLTSLCTALLLWGIFHLAIRLKCNSRLAQLFVTLGIVFVTGSLFLSPTLYVENHTDTGHEAIAEVSPEQKQVMEKPIQAVTETSFNELPSTPVSHQEEADRNIKDVVVSRLENALTYTYSHIRWIYGIGTGIFFLYLVMQLVWLNFVRRQSPLKERHDDYDIHRSIYSTPFSFSRHIFMPAGSESQKEEFVLAHETSHIRRHHFHKLLFSQCLLAFNWFNPFVWLMIKAIKELQEMEADADVLSKGFDREQYQINLILTCTDNKEWILAKSHYNYSSLKSRIIFMNKNIKNKHSRTIVLIATLGFILTGGLLTARTIEKKPSEQNIMPPYSATVSTEMPAAQEQLSPASKTVENINTPQTEAEFMSAAASRTKFDGHGCWTMLCIGDSAYRNFSITPRNKHYKFFAPKHSLTISICGRTESGMIQFTGATGTYKEKSQTTVMEGGNDRPRQWIDQDTFDDTWKDPYSISGIPGEYKTERWRRCEPSSILVRSLKCFDETEKRDDRLKGTWKCTCFGPGSDSIPSPVNYIQYKVYGKDRYVSFCPAGKEVENMFYTFNGHCGTFEYINDNLVLENNQGMRITWINNDSFYMDFQMNGHSFKEKWVRSDLPQDMKTLLKDVSKLCN